MPLSHSALRLSAGIVAWGAAMLGVLSLRALPLESEHSICGPWGCGPPVPALLACHGFWAVNLGALLVIGHGRLPRPQFRLVSRWAVGIGIAGLIGVAVWEGVTWWPDASDHVRHYALQRYGFRLATQIDFPIVETSLAGVVGLLITKRKGPAGNVLRSLHQR